MRRKQFLWLTVAVGWTLFVWIGRIRNALGDDSMAARVLTGTLLLCAVNLVGSLVIAAMAWHGRKSEPSVALVRVTWVFTAWTTVLWASRITDIAVGGDHPGAFVAVHTVIGLLSIILWVITAISLIERDSEEIVTVS